MDVITSVLALPPVSPMPNKAPTETWVVDTGMPNSLAKITNKAVVRLADRPWAGVIGMILWLMVSATRRALNTPPNSIATAITTIVHCRLKPGASNNNAAILGVSLRPRAKHTAPALQKCRLFSMRPASKPNMTPTSRSAQAVCVARLRLDERSGCHCCIGRICNQGFQVVQRISIRVD